MNIFVLDESPICAAKFHNDRHVIKMILESAQMLSTAHVYLDGAELSRSRVPSILKPSHTSHPCVRWVRESKFNYMWLHNLMTHLLVEYKLRYKRDHAYSGPNNLWDQLSSTPYNIPVVGRTPPPLCVPHKYRRASVVESYRLYYFHEKMHLGEWRDPASIPQWWTEMVEKEINRLLRKTA